jgi:hypothetical protein
MAAAPQRGIIARLDAFESELPDSFLMNTPEAKRNFFQSAVYNFFALYLGVTPPAPGQELFYAGLLLAAALVIVLAGYFMVHLLLSQMMG